MAKKEKTRGRREVKSRVSRRFITGISLILLVLIVFLAVNIRLRPFSNYEDVYKQALELGISEETAKFSYLHANDPWIMYWLSDYLSKNGISSWKTLTADNPVTKIFWYPWGRDFRGGEYPLLPILGSLGDSSLGVAKLVSILPVVAGALLPVVVFLIGWRLYNIYAGLIGSILVAVMPAATSRTFAGFVEKAGFAMPFVVLGLLLFAEAIRSRSRISAVGAGVCWGFIATVCGGYLLGGLTIAIVALFTPLFTRDFREAKELIVIYLYSSIPFLLLANILDVVGYGKVSFSLTLLPLIAICATLVLVLLATKLRVFSDKPSKNYFYLLLVVIIIGIIVAPYIGIRGRYYFAMVWPLRLAGVVELSRFAETVAEHSPYVTRFREFLDQTSIVGILAPLTAMYGVYLSYRRREPFHLPIHLLALGLYYGVLGMAYLLQAASVIGAISVATVIGVLLEPSRRETRRRVKSSEGEEIRRALAFFILIGVLVGVVYAYRATSYLNSAVASVTGYSIGMRNYGWFYMIDWIKENTPEDYKIVAWWDYGYWISVGTGRATLADGATINHTQIKLLAEFFTSTNDTEASAILERLKLEPNKTLVFVHDNVLYDPKEGSMLYTLPAAGGLSIDMAKSWAMLHIAGRSDEGFAVGNELYRETLIYRMFISAPFYINETGVFFPEYTRDIIGGNITSVGGFGTVSEPPEIKGLEPYLIVVAPYLDSNGNPVKLTDRHYLVLLLILYKWTGSP